MAEREEDRESRADGTPEPVAGSGHRPLPGDRPEPHPGGADAEPAGTPAAPAEPPAEPAGAPAEPSDGVAGPVSDGVAGPVSDDDAGPVSDDDAGPVSDDDAVWAALVAGFNDDPGARTWPESENLPGDRDLPGGRAAPGPATPPGPIHGLVVHPVIKGPRDYGVTENDDEGHYEPPEPPPLPDADVTTKFAWLGVLGGPLLLFAFVFLRWELEWWVVTVSIGGFLGGFATLVSRMRTDDDDDRPDGGAVV